MSYRPTIAETNEIFTKKLINRKMIGSVLKKLLTRDFEPKVKDILRRYSEECPAERSFMSDRFHPHADPTSFLTPLMKDMMWIAETTGNPLPEELNHPTHLAEWADMVSGYFGIKKITGYVKTSNKKVETEDRGAKMTRGWTNKKRVIRVRALQKHRKTCSAKFELDESCEVPSRMKGIKCLSVLYGRIHNWRDGWLTSHALPLGKTGLVVPLMKQFVEELGGWSKFIHDFPTTYCLIAIMVSVFSERKAFTLESQKQGGLNPYMEELLELAKRDESEAIHIIGLMLPHHEIYSRMSKDKVELVYTTSMKWLKTFAPFLEQQWKRGVNKCVRRSCRVPPRGAGVNSSGYNAVVDAWTNLRRFQTISSEYAGIKDAPLILKVMQLVADDQFRMAEGKVDHNAHVYKALTREVLPWNAVLHPESFDTKKAVGMLFELCQEHEVSFNSWVGVASKRATKVSHPVDMICGVSVPPMSPECADFLKRMGIFGAGTWHGESA